MKPRPVCVGYMWCEKSSQRDVGNMSKANLPPKAPPPWALAQSLWNCAKHIWHNTIRPDPSFLQPPQEARASAPPLLLDAPPGLEDEAPPDLPFPPLPPLQLPVVVEAAHGAESEEGAHACCCSLAVFLRTPVVCEDLARGYIKTRKCFI